MGIFTKKKQLASEKLMQLGIDLNSIKYENYAPEEISLDAEVSGVIKSSRAENVNFWKFNEIDISHYKDGKKLILLTRFPSVERDLKDIVDELSKVLGKDWLGRNELTSSDLNSYRNNEYKELGTREWKEYDDYTFELKAYVETTQIMLIIKSKNK